MSVDECNALIAARDQYGVKVGEAFAAYTHPQWQRVHELVRSREIWELRSIIASFGFMLQDAGNVRNVLEYGGGAIMDIGCYPIKLARWLFGEEPVSVAAVVDREYQTQVDQLSSVVLGFPSGQCVFTCGIHQVNHQSVQIVGTKARIEVPVPFNPHPSRNSQLRVDTGVDNWGSGVRVEEFAPCDQYTIQGDQFSRAVRGVGDVPTGLEDSVKNMAVIEAVFESARTGRVLGLA
jgi:predicted dehydrogenase